MEKMKRSFLLAVVAMVMTMFSCSSIVLATEEPFSIRPVTNGIATVFPADTGGQFGIVVEDIWGDGVSGINVHAFISPMYYFGEDGLLYCEEAGKILDNPDFPLFTDEKGEAWFDIPPPLSKKNGRFYDFHFWLSGVVDDNVIYAGINLFSFSKASNPTCSISANPTSITSGAGSTLSWSSTNATSASISGVGTVNTSGSMTVYPTVTTTYIGTFTGTGGTTTCSVTVTTSGGASSIEAVNPTSYEGSLPVWTTGLNQSVVMVFVVKDANGSPVPGVQLTVVYPAGSGTTDSNGQISVSSPSSQFAGWDTGRIYVTSNYSGVSLDFKMKYQ